MPLSRVEYQLEIRRNASQRVASLLKSAKGIGGISVVVVGGLILAYLKGELTGGPDLPGAYVASSLAVLLGALIVLYVWALKQESYEAYQTAQRKVEAMEDQDGRLKRERLKEAIDAARLKAGSTTFPWFLGSPEYARIRDFLDDIDVIEGREEPSFEPSRSGEPRRDAFLDSLARLEREVELIERPPKRGKFQVEIV